MDNIINQDLANFYRKEDLSPLLSLEEEHSLAMKIKNSDGGEKDRLLLNEDPVSSVIFKGHLESNPSTFVVVILSDEDNPASNTVNFLNVKVLMDLKEFFT